VDSVVGEYMSGKTKLPYKNFNVWLFISPHTDINTREVINLVEILSKAGGF
jgi:hypothetical protein